MPSEKRTVILKGRQCGYSAAQIQVLKKALRPNEINKLADVTPQRIEERKNKDWSGGGCVLSQDEISSILKMHRVDKSYTFLSCAKANSAILKMMRE